MTTYKHHIRCLRCGSVNVIMAKRFTAPLYNICEKCMKRQSERETQHPDSYQLYWGIK